MLRVPGSDWVADALASTAGDPVARLELVCGWLDDRLAARSFWRHVLQQGGLRAGGHVFIAEPERVGELLESASVSTRELGRRMQPTTGRFMLGMDDAEHARCASLAAVIPSANLPGRAVDTEELRRVRQIASEVTGATLHDFAARCVLARLTQPQAPCACPVAALLAPVLDAGLCYAFGIVAPSQSSLLRWAKDITGYHFRVGASETVDRQRALLAGAQFREHVLQAVIMARPSDVKLTMVVRQLRAAAGTELSDAEVAVNLVGLMIGALTAPYRAFTDALLGHAEQQSDRRAPLSWPEPRRGARFPWFDAIVAPALVRSERATPDAIYRKYRDASPRRVGNVELHRDDTLVLWMGGRLAACPDDLFGVGMHKCPGMDMGKALLDGVLCVLCELTQELAPRLICERDDPVLVFDEPELLARRLSPDAAAGAGNGGRETAASNGT